MVEFMKVKKDVNKMNTNFVNIQSKVDDVITQDDFTELDDKVNEFQY